MRSAHSQRVRPRTGRQQRELQGHNGYVVIRGLSFSPDGDLFYCDNQGEWVATNKLHHLRRGRFYGHQAGLKWVKDSPFAGTLPVPMPASRMACSSSTGKCPAWMASNSSARSINEISGSLQP